MIGCNQLLTALNINSVETWISQSWTGNCHMDFCSPCFFQQFHNPTRSGSTYDRVINHDNPFAFYDTRYGRELHPHPLFPQFLSRLDKGPLDILILDQAHFIWQTRFFRKAHSSTEGGVGNPHYNICLVLKFSCQLSSHPLASRMDINSLDIGIRTSKIDILHGTNR